MCLPCLFAFQGEWNQGVASEPLTFSNLEAENAAAVGACWAHEKCSSVAFFSMRGRGGGVCLCNTLWPEFGSIRFLPRKCILQRCPFWLS